jgi:predicted acetyltransferase
VLWELRGVERIDPAQARAAHAELARDGFSFLTFFDPAETWDAYLTRVVPLSRGEGLSSGFVPWTDLYGVADGVLVGRVSVRHRLTESLTHLGGHMNYGVRPKYRRRGYATALMCAGLDVARAQGIDAALVTCDDDNLESVTVIERCSGVLDSVQPVVDGPPQRRYWVPTG